MSVGNDKDLLSFLIIFILIGLLRDKLSEALLLRPMILAISFWDNFICSILNFIASIGSGSGNSPTV